MKGLATANRWVAAANGQGIKVVTQLRRCLRKERNGRVILKDRPFDDDAAAAGRLNSVRTQRRSDVALPIDAGRHSSE